MCWPEAVLGPAAPARSRGAGVTAEVTRPAPVKIVDRYPAILKVIKRGARMGRKENVVTMLASQGYQDFQHVHDLTKTAGVKLIGKQIGDYDKLVQDAGLSLGAVGAVSAIRNVPGLLPSPTRRGLSWKGGLHRLMTGAFWSLAPVGFPRSPSVYIFAEQPKSGPSISCPGSALPR